jgi:N-methylhydantoinase A
LLACGVADILELAEVIVPPRPGLLAAWGLLVAPQRRESALTVLRLLDEMTPQEAEQYFSEAAQKLSTKPPQGAQLLRIASLRYLGQGFEVDVNVQEPLDLARLAEDFHAAHEHEYGFSMKGSAVEWVELRVAWEMPVEEWGFPASGEPPADQPRFTPLYERTLQSNEIQRVTAALHERRKLPSQAVIPGAAVIVEKDATIYIPSGWTGQLTDNGYLRIRRNDTSN